MATETLSAAHDRDTQDFIPGQRRDTVVVIGAGKNTLNMKKSLAHLATEHPLHVFEVSEPLIPVDPDHLHMTDTEKGRRSSERLLGSGVVHAVYLSATLSVRDKMNDPLIELAAKNYIDSIATTKPLAANPSKAIGLRKKVRAAEKQRQQIDPDYDPEKNPLYLIHEHYLEKGPVKALIELLGQIVNRLGYVQSIDTSIQEKRTVEGEDRLDAVAEGAFMDLSPHTISITLAAQAAINTSERYRVPNRSSSSLERFRYEGSRLQENTETGFIVRGQSTVIDTERGESYDTSFNWYGGKGLVDKKEVVLTFVNPDTGEKSIITADLIANTITVPESVGHLFSITEFEDGYGRCSFEDNGYGISVESGLNGGDPRESFQSLDDAIIVTKWQHALLSKCRDDERNVIPPTDCQQGIDLYDFA